MLIGPDAVLAEPELADEDDELDEEFEELPHAASTSAEVAATSTPDTHLLRLTTKYLLHEVDPVPREI